ncbi:MAG TPA: glycosyltransferase family 4 protein, partial [Anaeromyxobacter sp.]|nr:glycosyltransferase family 4 protein [Anaeromyxobacter sp.]
MRILLLGGVDLSRPGGLETHLLELSRCLAARGHAVEIFGRPASLPPHSMVSAVDPARYDVIHDHGGWPPGLEPAPRHVRTLHFCVAAKMETYVRIGRLRTLVNPENWRARSAERAAVRRAERFIAVSRRVQSEFERHHGLDPTRATVIPNGASFASP